MESEEWGWDETTRGARNSVLVCVSAATTSSQFPVGPVVGESEGRSVGARPGLDSHEGTQEEVGRRKSRRCPSDVSEGPTPSELVVSVPGLNAR